MSVRHRMLFIRGIIAVLVCSIATVSSGCKKNEETALSEAKDAKYHVGEKWGFKARSGEDHAAFTVVKVEANPKLGNIVHVSVEGVRIKSPANPGGFIDKVPHMPFAEAAIDRSATDLVSKRAPIPEFESSYRQWRASFVTKRGTIFTSTVKEGVDFIEKSLN